MTELWDVYDQHRNRTGQTVERGEIPEGCYHIVVHICLFNARGEMLIQQRQPFKQGWPNMWDVTVGGSALAGEDSQQAAAREMREEIGYAYGFSKTRPRFTVNFDRGFDDYYLLEADVDLEKLTLQYEEVQRVKWAARDEIYRMRDEGLFIPYRKGLIAWMFEARKQYGALEMSN